MNQIFNVVEEITKRLALLELGSDLTIVLPNDIPEATVRSIAFELSLLSVRSLTIIVDKNKLIVYLSSGKGSKE